MGDKQKKPAEKKRTNKRLALKKETIQELSEADLDRVAGGVTGGAATGVQRATGPIGPTGADGGATCSETMA